MQCPRCGYSRSINDSNPDWQCPSCKIAYIKHQESEPFEVAGHFKKNPYYLQTQYTKQSNYRFRWLIIMVAFLILVKFVSISPDAQKSESIITSSEVINELRDQFDLSPDIDTTGDPTKDNNYLTKFFKDELSLLGSSIDILNLNREAKSGNLRAQFTLGIMYFNGYGVPKNTNTALFWFTQAAERNDPASQYALGLLILYGEGTKSDKAKAKTWIIKSACNGYDPAEFMLIYDPIILGL